MPSQRPVVLPEERLELTAVLAAGVALRPVDPPPVPGQPPTGIGVDVLPVAEVEKLRLQRRLGLRVGTRAADLASEDD
jgi:hypothetical protein